MNLCLLSRRLPRRALSALALALPLLLLASCGGGFFIESRQGSVRLVDATTDFASGLDLYQSGTLLSSATLPYTAGPYVDLDADSYTFNLRAAGATTNAASLSGSISRGDRATIVAYTSGGALAATQLSDEEGDPRSGYAKLRVFHTASADTGNVDVYLADGACSGLPSTSTAAFASNVSGLQTSYTEVAAAGGGTTYHVCVTANGAKDDLRLEIASFTLKDGQIATLVLVRTPGGFLLNGLRLDQQGALTQQLNGSARLRVAASASGGAAVSASANGTAVAANLVSPAVGAYTLIGAGALTVDLSVGGASVPVSGLSSVAAGADVTLLVTGSGSASLITDDNTASTSTSRPVKLRLVNGLNGGTGGLTLTADGSVVASNVALGAASTAALVAANSGGAALQASNSGGTVLTLTGQTLVTGGSYALFVLGDAGAPAGVLRNSH